MLCIVCNNVVGIRQESWKHPVCSNSCRQKFWRRAKDLKEFTQKRINIAYLILDTSEVK